MRTVAVAGALLILGVAPAAGGHRAGAVTITVTAGKPSEYGFKLSRSAVPLGPVVFQVVNRGKVKHNFAIAGKTTPVLTPGKSAKLTVVFTKAGPYSYSSSLRGQSANGMKGVVAVRTTVSPGRSTTPTTVAQGTGSAGGSTVGAACASPAGTTISVRMFDFGFTLSQTTVPCGNVTFVVTNTGQVTHNFDVESTGSNGKPVFNGGTTLLGGETATQAISFGTSGTFRYQCDLHFAQGQMVGVLTVT
jgi:plastocyanin